MPFPRLTRRLIALLVLAAAPRGLAAQDPEAPAQAGTLVDTVVVEGASRLDPAQVVSAGGIGAGRLVGYRDIQRAIAALFRTGQFDDVVVEQRTLPDGRVALAYRVRERPLLTGWSIQGNEKVSSGDVREVVQLAEGRPLDRAMVERGRARIDSVYKRQGYYTASIEARTSPAQGGVQVVYEIDEGSRVVISQVAVEGNRLVPADQIVAQMATKPEGFWWFRKGEYDQQKLESDLRERLPAWYADRGHIDFQVTGDTLVPDSTAGKATLRIRVEEGPVYRVGSFEMAGNQRYSTDELLNLYPFARDTSGAPRAGQPFDRGAWQAATEQLTNLYYNNGYISAQVMPIEERRAGPDGTPVVDLRWNIREGSVATINKVNIVGNDVTHERVIREAIIMLPGEVFSRDKLVRSYQNVSNLGFFQQPMPPPDVQPAENGVDVDITFRVEEKRTGNINFGASLGQGTGIGGFLGLEEPNLFGRGKRGRLQWQFGARVNDFNLSYTDPSIRESRISGTISLYDSRVRYTIEDLGRIRRTGGSLQIGFPLLGSRYTRIFTSYGLQLNKLSEGAEDIQSRFGNCENCTRSTVGVGLLRDTRVGLPFAVAGMSTNVTAELNGGVLGGSGNYRKVDLEGRWYTPLGTMGGSGDQFGGGIQFVLGFTAKTGLVFGDEGPFFTELYTLGGVQFGVPLRGYDECSITPGGFNPSAQGSSCSADSFGKAFAVFSAELGARVSQSLYLSSFIDAGNVYRTAGQFDPTRLFRGAGLGAALVSPLGPIGVDLAYGFDKVDSSGKPAPGWQIHFKLGNFF
jgi:outer membrane protein insertion porin family